MRQIIYENNVITVSEGNKLIADLLGYEYIASNNPIREPLVRNGYVLNHGYWRRKVRDINDLGKVASEGFQIIIHSPKLTFHDRWEDIMKVVSFIERYEGYNTEFVINKSGVVLTSQPTKDIAGLTINMLYHNNKSLERLRVLWSCVVIWCIYHKEREQPNATSI